MSKCRECFGAAAEAAAAASGNMKMILGMSTASVNCARMESCGRGEMRMQEQEKKILDPCCGSKMFWFNKNNPSVRGG